MKSLLTINSKSDYAFQLKLLQKKNILPPHFNRLFEGLVVALFKFGIDIKLIILNYINMAPSNVNLYHCCAGKSKFNAVSTSQSKSKQAWAPIQYKDAVSHCGDKTVVRSSYLHNGISYTGKTASLYWIKDQVSMVPHAQWYHPTVRP